jgi:hypothetical protein
MTLLVLFAAIVATNVGLRFWHIALIAPAA